MTTNISHWIEHHAAFTPNKTAIHFEARNISYAEMADEISHTATLLQSQLGLKQGDRIAHLGYNSPEMLIYAVTCRW